MVGERRGDCSDLDSTNSKREGVVEPGHWVMSLIHLSGRVLRGELRGDELMAGRGSGSTKFIFWGALKLLETAYAVERRFGHNQTRGQHSTINRRDSRPSDTDGHEEGSK